MSPTLAAAPKQPTMTRWALLLTTVRQERRGRVIGISSSIAGLAVAAGGRPVKSAHPPHLYRRTLPHR